MLLQRFDGWQRSHWYPSVKLGVPRKLGVLASRGSPTTAAPVMMSMFGGRAANVDAAGLHESRRSCATANDACGLSGWALVPSAFITSSTAPPEPAKAIWLPSGDHAGAKAEPDEVNACAFAPLASTTQIAYGPVPRTNRILLLSGDHAMAPPMPVGSARSPSVVSWA